MSDFVVALLGAVKDGDLLTVWVFAILLAAAAFIAVPPARHRRWRAGIVFALVGVLLTYTLRNVGAIPTLVAVIMLAMVAALSGLWLYTTALRQAPLPWEQGAIESLKHRVFTGRLSYPQQALGSKPWFIHSVPGRVRWTSLAADALMDEGHLGQAHAAYTELLSLPLLPAERTEVQIKRTCSLWASGDTLGAERVFRIIEKVVSSGYDRHWLRALLAERAGELEAARSNWLAAVAHQQTGSGKLAKGYNNLGRIQGILHNRAEALHYYRKAASLAGESRNRMVLHSVYPNLIDTLLLTDECDEAVRAFRLYSSLVDTSVAGESIKLYNYRLQFARQTGDQELLKETLRYAENRILPRLSGEQRLIFRSSAKVTPFSPLAK